MPIGTLNGSWERLFKMVLALTAMVLPLIIALNVWFVREVFNLKNTNVLIVYKLDQFVNSDTFMSKEHAEITHMKLVSEIMAAVESRNPPQWLRDEVESQRLELNRIRRIAEEQRDKAR